MVFNFDDVTFLCEFMIQNNHYIEAYCYIKAIIDFYMKLIIRRIRVNLQSFDKISKLLGMAECVFVEVTHLNKIILKAMTARGFKFAVE